MHRSGRARKPILDELFALAAKGEFDEAERNLIAFVQQHPADAEVVWSYLDELRVKYGQHERAAAIVSKVLPGIEKNRPEAFGVMLCKRASSVLMGRYGKNGNRKDLNRAKNDLILAVTIDERLAEGWLHLAIVEGIDGKLEPANSSLRRAHETCKDPEGKKKIEWLLALLNENPNEFVELSRTFYVRN